MRRAAEAINMTQPAVSQQVAELEKLIGAELFFRHAKGVEPTEVAQELLPVAHRVILALQDGSEAIAHRLRAETGVVRVAASPAAIGGLLLTSLGQFSETHPDVQVQIIESAGLGQIESSVPEAADILCTREPEIVPEGWQFVPCLEDQLIVVCGARHPLALKPKVSAKELGQYKWLMNRVASVARRRFEDAFLAHDWAEDVRGSLILHIPELTKELLTSRDFLAILPKSVALPWLTSGEIAALDTSLSEQLAPLGILRPQAKQGGAIERFVGFLQMRFPRGPASPSSA